MVAYLMYRFRWSLEKAYTLVCRARPIVAPNRGFLSALIKLEARLFGENTMTIRRRANNSHVLSPLIQSGHL